MLSNEFLPVKLVDVSITNVGFAIFLQPIDANDSIVVPIFIGPLETHSISAALDGVQPPRPSTHDLMINALKEMDARMEHIIISDIIGSVFYARIIIQIDEDIIELDSRPSDAIALAIRAKCPIYMHEKVYQKGCINLIKKEGHHRSPDIEIENEASILENIISPIEKSNPKESISSSTRKKPTRSFSKEDYTKQELEKLSKKLNEAIELEDFEQAVVLRDKMKQLQDSWQAHLQLLNEKKSSKPNKSKSSDDSSDTPNQKKKGKEQNNHEEKINSEE